MPYGVPGCNEQAGSMVPIIGIIPPRPEHSRKLPDEVDHAGNRTADSVLQPCMMQRYMSVACFLEGALPGGSMTFGRDRLDQR
jgi:hypothetical protein